MATVFETRLIGNLGKDASVRNMDRGVVAINFPVAHNKNWKDKKTGESRTKTVWVNCTIWKKEGSNMRVLDFLKKGTLVELVGTSYAKAFKLEDDTIRTEIRLNVSKTNILKLSKSVNPSDEGYDGSNDNDEGDDDEDYFTLNEEEF